MDLKDKLIAYEKQFRENDQEIYKTTISNHEALSFLLDQIPRVELPDQIMERTYYFRYWTYRKHIRNTEHGIIITEFLPDVYWAGACNSINCGTPFHLMEGRWLKDANKYLENYIDFFLDGIGDSFSYSMSFITSICDYAEIVGAEAYVDARYDKIKAWHEIRLTKTKKVGELYYSIDDRDGMEYGIGGSGLRPTINSYICADAMALSKLARRVGKLEDAKYYEAFANNLRDNMFKLMWSGDFFVTIPECVMEEFGRDGVIIPDEHYVRELIGYVPWMYGIADKSHKAAWKYLMDSKCFYTKYGLTTAAQSHPRFMEYHDHACLWNGPIWPYATSQILTAVARSKRADKQFPISAEDYVDLLHIYANSHKRITSDGKVIDWIDEDMSPIDGSWISRDFLKNLGFPKKFGGYERGKDYNHSLFGDLILSGLMGISCENGELSVRPLIPESWDYFKVENLHFRGKRYTITFDRNGSYYGEGKGIVIKEEIK